MNGRTLTVRPTGELDAHTAPVLRRRLTELLEAGDDVVVDLSAVTLLGAAGGRVILDTQRRWHGCGGRLHLVRPSAPVARVLRLLGVPVPTPPGAGVFPSDDDATDETARA